MKKSTIALIAAFIIFFVFQIVIVWHFTGKIADGMRFSVEKQKNIVDTVNIQQESNDSIASSDSILFKKNSMFEI